MNKTGHQFRISRRTMLRGAGGVLMGLPLLDVMTSARPVLAQSVPGYTALGHPKRFIVVFSPNGTIPQNWTPSGAGENFEFSPILEPLSPFRNKVLIVDGVDQTGGSGGDAHQSGFQGMLTGQVCNPGPFMGGDGKSAGWANGISVDQRVADVIGQETPFRSLELAVQPSQSESNITRMCLRGPDQPVAPEPSPHAAYSRLFAGGTTPNTPDSLLQNERQKRVLDAVQGNLARLQAKVGKKDREKLEQHAQQLFEIEERLDKRPPAALDACEEPQMGEEFDTHAGSAFPLIGKLHMDLTTMAFACDLTRVASIQWNYAIGQVRYDFADGSITRGHHDMSHDGDENLVTLTQLTNVNRWYAEQFAYLLGRLDAIPEGDGTMLDNTVVFWCNELAKGNTHALTNSHFVVAGGASYFKMGRCLKFDYETGPKHNNLLLSLVHSMGIEDTSFGMPEWCTGPLDGMTG